MNQPPAPLIKIFRSDEWADFAATGVFAGSADDQRDGFIHLSRAEQVAGTLARHFAGATGLVAAELTLDGDADLRWEPARSGETFPHLYRPLRRADVARFTLL